MNDTVTQAAPETPTPAEPFGVVPERERLSFRGRIYERGAVAARDGVALKGLLLQMRNADQEGSNTARAEALRQIRRAAPWILHRVLRPVGWRLLVRWITPNAFRGANPRELGVLIGFAVRGTYVNRVRFPNQEAGHERD